MDMVYRYHNERFGCIRRIGGDRISRLDQHCGVVKIAVAVIPVIVNSQVKNGDWLPDYYGQKPSRIIR